MTKSEALKVAKPILFNTEMVRAIQSGTKTTTRQIVKSKNDDLSKCRFVEMSTDPAETRIAKNGDEYPHDLKGLYATFEDVDGGYFPLVKAPYEVGEILYIQQMWGYRYCWECEQQGVGDECELEHQKFKSAPFGEYGCYTFPDECDEPVDHQWHSASSMPKAAARIFLRVTGVRVERLQDIRLLEIIREGVPVLQKLKEYGYEMSEDDIGRLEYKRCWNSTIKKSYIEKYGWDANPWVWVIAFERMGVEL